MVIPFFHLTKLSWRDCHDERRSCHCPWCVRGLCQKGPRRDRGSIGTGFSFYEPARQPARPRYFARCWPNSATIASFDFFHLVPDGERVFVTYEGRSTAGHRFRNTEIVTIRGRQIVDVEVYFGWSVPYEAPVGGFIDKK